MSQPTLTLVRQGLRTWDSRQVAAAAATALAVGLLLGVSTVLIPNPIFGRDIPPVWWNYPVWILTSVLSGMLVATYVRRKDETSVVRSTTADAEETRTSRLGLAGGVLAWFAVGCPVCNKIALLALGYSGAITWFAPAQPVLALAALALTGVAVVVRLRGQAYCPLPRPRTAEVAR